MHAMLNFCATCFKELPTSDDQSQYSIQCDENLIKIIYINTGIALNLKENSPKQLCNSCYMKIMAFDEFRDTAFCCATAIHELLLEENFSNNTLNNLQYFCCTCLSKMHTLNDTSKQLNNIEIKRWMEECIKLKEDTAVEQWPNYFCDCCWMKLKDFLAFEHLAKESLKKLEDELKDQEKYESEKELAEPEDTNKERSKIKDGLNSTVIENSRIEDQSSAVLLRKTNSKSKKKQRLRGKNSTSTTLKSLDALKTRSDISIVVRDVSATTCYNVVETSDLTFKNDMESEKISSPPKHINKTVDSGTSYPEISEGAVLNDKSMQIKSCILIENTTVIDSFEEDVGHKGEKIETKISENDNSNNTMSTEYISMASMTNNPAESDITVETHTAKDYKLAVNMGLKTTHSHPTTSNNAILKQKSAKKNISKSSKNKSTATNLAKSDMVLGAPTAIEFKLVEDVGLKSQETDAEVSENTLLNETISKGKMLMPSNNKSISDDPTNSDILTEGPPAIGLNSKTCDANISEDATFNRPSSIKNKSKATTNNKLKSKKRVKSDILTESPTANEATHLDEVGLNKNSDTEIPNSKKIISKASSNTSASQKSDILDENPTDFGAFVEDVELKSKTSDAKISEYPINQPSSSKSTESLTDIDSLVDSEGLKGARSDVQISENDILNKTCLTENISEASNNKYTSEKPEESDILVESGTAIDSLVEDVVPKGESRNFKISENDILDQATPPENISMASNKPAKSDLIIETHQASVSKIVVNAGLKRKHSDPKASGNAINQKSDFNQPSSKKNVSKATTNTKPKSKKRAMCIDGVELKSKNIDSEISGDPVLKQPNSNNKITPEKLAKSDILTQNPIIIDSTQVNDVGLNRKDNDAEITKDTITITNTITKASSDKSTSNKSDILDENPTDINSFVEDVGLKSKNSDAEISEDAVNQPSSAKNKHISKNLAKTGTSAEILTDIASLVEDEGQKGARSGIQISETDIPKKASSTEKQIPDIAESSKAIDSLEKDVGLKSVTNDVPISGKDILNQTNPTENLANVSINKSTPSKPAKSDIIVEPHTAKDSEVAVNAGIKRKHSDPKTSRNQKSAKRSISKASNNKPPSTNRAEPGSSAESLTSIDSIVEDEGLKGARSEMQIYENCIPNNTSSTEKQKPDLAESPKAIDSPVKDMGLKAVANNIPISGKDILNQTSLTDNIAKLSINKSNSSESAKSDIIVEPHTSKDSKISVNAEPKRKHSDQKPSRNPVNQKSVKNNISKALNNKPTSNNPVEPGTSDESLTNINSVIEEGGLKGTKGDIQMSVYDTLNISPIENISKASNDKSTSNKPARSNALVENSKSSDSAYIEDIGQTSKKISKNATPTENISLTSSRKSMSNESEILFEDPNQKSSTKYTSKEITSNKPSTISTFAVDKGLKSKSRDTKVSGGYVINHKSAAKYTSITSNNKWTSSKPAKSEILGEGPVAIDSTFAADGSYNRKGPATPTSNFRKPNLNVHSVHNIHNSMQRHTYETNESPAKNFTPYSMQNYFQCLVCMKTFKRRGHLNKHRRFSPRCARI